MTAPASDGRGIPSTQGVISPPPGAGRRGRGRQGPGTRRGERGEGELSGVRKKDDEVEPELSEEAAELPGRPGREQGHAPRRRPVLGVFADAEEKEVGDRAPGAAVAAHEIGATRRERTEHPHAQASAGRGAAEAVSAGVLDARRDDLERQILEPGVEPCHLRRRDGGRRDVNDSGPPSEPQPLVEQVTSPVGEGVEELEGAEVDLGLRESPVERPETVAAEVGGVEVADAVLALDPFDQRLDLGVPRSEQSHRPGQHPGAEVCAAARFGQAQADPVAPGHAEGGEPQVAREGVGAREAAAPVVGGVVTGVVRQVEVGALAHEDPLRVFHQPPIPRSGAV